MNRCDFISNGNFFYGVVSMLSPFFLFQVFLLTFAEEKQAITQIEAKLDILYSQDRTFCFELIGKAKLISANQIGSVVHTYKFSECNLFIIKHDLGYQAFRRVFNYSSPGFQIDNVTTVAPTYEARYIAGPDLTLPTGRLFLFDNNFRFVLCDRKRCELFTYNSQLLKFEKDERKSKELSAAVRALFESSFSLNDVYWSYCLVRNGNFFGGNKINIDFQKKFIDTQALFSMWKEVKGARNQQE